MQCFCCQTSQFPNCLYTQTTPLSIGASANMKPASKSSSPLPELFVGQIPATQELGTSFVTPWENHVFQEQWNCHTPEQGSGAEQIASLAAGPQCWSSLPGEIRGSKNLIAITAKHSTCSYQRFLTRVKKNPKVSLQIRGCRNREKITQLMSCTQLCYQLRQHWSVKDRQKLLAEPVLHLEDYPTNIWTENCLPT